MVSLNDLGTVEAIRDFGMNFGLLKYFRLYGMRQQLELLHFLVHSWDPMDQDFHIGGKVFPILIDDVYFLIGFSRRGAPISLLGFSSGLNN